MVSLYLNRNLHYPTHHYQWEILLYDIRHSQGKWNHGCAWHWHHWDTSILLGNLFLSTFQLLLQYLPLLYHSLHPLLRYRIRIMMCFSSHPIMQCYQQRCDSKLLVSLIWFITLSLLFSWVNSISIIPLSIPYSHPTLHGVSCCFPLVGSQSLLHVSCLKWAWQIVLDDSMIVQESLSMEPAWTTLLWRPGSILIAYSWHPSLFYLWSWRGVYWCALSFG